MIETVLALISNPALIRGAVTVVVAIIVLLLIIYLTALTSRHVLKLYSAFSLNLAENRAKRAELKAKKKAETILAAAVSQASAKLSLFEDEYTKALQNDRKQIEQFLERYNVELTNTIIEIAYGIAGNSNRAADKFGQALEELEQQVSQNTIVARQRLDSMTEKSAALVAQLSCDLKKVDDGIEEMAVGLSEVARLESEKNAEIVHSELRKIGAEAVTVMGSIPDQMKQMRKDAADAIGEVTSDLSKTVQTTMNKELDAISDEVSRYRALRIQMVDERILVLVTETAKVALQKELSAENQAELVYRSLEEAKQSGIFT
jgi:hypothetical protein